MKRIEILKISLGLIRIQKGKKPRIRALFIRQVGTFQHESLTLNVFIIARNSYLH
jgi:hypothetical protein